MKATFLKTLFFSLALTIATPVMAGLSSLTPGSQAPDEVNVVIEIPAGSSPVKYETDKETNMLFVNRFLSTAMFYPCNYGYVPKTLANDGDPVDVLVITPTPLISGSVIKVRPIGILFMTDEEGEDNKILAVPADALTSLYSKIKNTKDIPVDLLDKINYFFKHYKDLEKDKWVKTDGWGSVKDAKKEISQGMQRYNAPPSSKLSSSSN